MNWLITRHMGANGHSREVAGARVAVNDRLNAEIDWPSRASAQWLAANHWSPVGLRWTPKFVAENSNLTETFNGMSQYSDTVLKL